MSKYEAFARKWSHGTQASNEADAYGDAANDASMVTCSGCQKSWQAQYPQWGALFCADCVRAGVHRLYFRLEDGERDYAEGKISKRERNAWRHAYKYAVRASVRDQKRG